MPVAVTLALVSVYGKSVRRVRQIAVLNQADGQSRMTSHAE
jgi:hypothetical protein